MAFNWQTFKTRTITAAIFVVVMLVGLLWNQWSFFILFSIIHFGCWWEYLGLIEKIHQTTFHKNLKLGFMLFGYGLLCLFGPVSYFVDFGFEELFFSVIPLVGLVLLIIGASQTINLKARTFGLVSMGLLYISLSLALMIGLFHIGTFEIFAKDYKYVTDQFLLGYRLLPLAIIFTLWINDTMAYLVGSIIGKTPLSKISPKKTWEGTIGGIILSVFTIGLLFSSNFPLFIIRVSLIISTHLPSSFIKQITEKYPFTMNNLYWYITAAIVAIAGTFGDLFESKLKRMANVKDSGNIMPGHGGFLDRFDSMLLAIPAVWLYVYFFLR